MMIQQQRHYNEKFSSRMQLGFQMTAFCYGNSEDSFEKSLALPDWQPETEFSA